ncbi:hypothetical protein KXD40_006076 [Peronospora effusa]|nr:hypothetical protein KXD40_006076 [Peronospora effusa]
MLKDTPERTRQLTTKFTLNHFFLSKLTVKAKEWALGKLVANLGCFPDMQALKDDLRLLFVPPQDELHHRYAFVASWHGSLSMLDYIQCARHLASCIVAAPIDTVT